MKDTNEKELQEIKNYLQAGRIREFEQKWEKLKADLEGHAFMERYRYAIKVLEECIPKKNGKTD